MTVGNPFPESDITGFRVGSFRLAAQSAPWRFSLLHDRPTDILLWVTKGQGRVTLNGVNCGVAVHNAVYIPSGTLFALDFGQQVQALLVESPAAFVPALPQSPVILKARDSDAQTELTSLLDAMSRERLRARLFLDKALEAYMQLVAVWMQRQSAEGTAQDTVDTAATRLVRRYAQAVVRSYAQPVSMGTYAEALDVTPTHLTRTCRHCCGRTAADILTERRVHAGRTLLETTHVPIKDVAARLGFASAAYFTRFIQQHCGAAPSALRASAAARRGQL